MIVGVLLLMAGCAENPATDSRTASKPYSTCTLKLSCPDRPFAEAVRPFVRSWSRRTGATVELLLAPMTPDDTIDAGIIPAADLGAWAEPEAIAPVPATLKSADNAYQWAGVLPAYRDRLAGWGSQVYGVPLAGAGEVLVYRTDRFAEPRAVAEFRKRFARPLGEPATWEDVAEIAECFTALDGRAALPPLAADAAAVADSFFRVAACFDRQAGIDTESEKRPRNVVVSFQFDRATGLPRLTTPGLEAAGGWMARVGKCRLATGPADLSSPTGPVCFVLSLAELDRLPREDGVVPSRFGIVPLPGTRSFVDPATGKMTPPQPVANYVPYLAGGKLGVVRSRCQCPEAAFDLLAELGSPGRSLALLSTPGLGAGPFRELHLDRERQFLWLGYGLDPERTRRLQEAMRHFVGKAVGNAVYGLRGPDRLDQETVLAAELRKIGGGDLPADKGLQQAAAAWRKLDSAVDPQKLLGRRRHADWLN